MNSPLKIVLAASTLLAMAACGGGAYVSGGGGGVYYDGYYDGHYGPFYDGYWGDDSAFYYSGGRGRPYVRDDGNHFRHDSAAGFNAFHHAHTGPHTDHPHEAPHG